MNPYAATHDTLTGLPNKFLFYDRLYMAISSAERTASRFAIILIRTGNFQASPFEKTSEAHKQALVHLSSTLEASLRETDSIGRLTDNEFAILFTHVTSKDAIEYLRWRIEKTLVNMFDEINPKFNLGFSLGSSTYPDNGNNIYKLMTYAYSNIKNTYH